MYNFAADVHANAFKVNCTFRRNRRFIDDSTSEPEDGPSQAALLQVAASKRETLLAKTRMMKRKQGPGVYFLQIKVTAVGLVLLQKGVRICVCMYVYMYVWMYVCMCICIYVCMYVYV